VAGQGFFHLGQQVVAAEKNSTGLGQFVDGRFWASVSFQVRLTTQGASICMGIIA
jgi:hypothetical protein